MNVVPDGAMTAIDHQADGVCAQPGKSEPAWRSFARSRDGSAAIEFALLAIPYFMVIFAILETFVAFAAEQLVSNAVDTMSRKMRTGQITNVVGSRPIWTRRHSGRNSATRSRS